MIATGDDNNIFALYRVNQAVGVIDAAAPEAGKISGQGFRLSEACVPISGDVI